jgi:hypothetical protein
VIGTPTYQLAEHSAGMLTLLVGHMEYLIKNSVDFIQELKFTTVKEMDILISFDVLFSPKYCSRGPYSCYNNNSEVEY